MQKFNTLKTVTLIITINCRTIYFIKESDQITIYRQLPDVSWDSKMVGFLHSAFFIGYVITQLPGGFLANRFPAHWYITLF